MVTCYAEDCDIDSNTFRHAYIKFLEFELEAGVHLVTITPIDLY